MEQNFLVRLAIESNANDLSQMNYEFNGLRIPESQIIQSLENNSELVAVAELDGQAVGFATSQIYKSFCYSSAQGEITEMYVREGFRRRGISKLLIEFLEKELKKKGVKTVKILTGNDNIAAIDSYKKAGYTVDDEILLYKRI